MCPRSTTPSKLPRQARRIGMLKHVSVSPWRGRADSVSLASSGGASSCGSGSPTPGHTPPPSRASSCASLAPLTALSSFSPADNAPQQTTIKVYANCLRPDIEYKTLSISYETTCREVVQNLLNKYRMRHRDPRLFYLTMEVTVRRANVRTVLPLDEDARPAILQSCHPRGDSRFSLQTRRGGLVKIYDSALMSGSKYKSLLVSEQTTVDELIQMLLSCYSSKERVEQFSLYEVCEGEEYQRKLHPDDSPLKVTQRWSGSDRHLRIRRNPDYNPHRRKSMWASDSSITTAMARLNLVSCHTRYVQHTENNNPFNLYRHNDICNESSSGSTTSTTVTTTAATITTGNHSNSNSNGSKTCNHDNSNDNNDDDENDDDDVDRNYHHRKCHFQKLSQHHPSLGSLNRQSKIVIPYATQLPQLQLTRVQQLPQSVPSTPLTLKHATTSTYTDYENYLFI